MDGLNGVGRDVRTALRSLRRSPAHAFVAVATLALGIGAATTIQSIVEPLLLRPLQFTEPDRLVTISTGLLRGEADLLGQRSRTLDAVSVYNPGRAYGLSGDGEAERATGAGVTPNLFETLGVRPLLGTSPAGATAGERTVVIGHDLWSRRFGGDAGVIGRMVRVDGEPHTIAAVMPPGFTFPMRAQLWVVTPLDPSRPGEYWGYGGRMVARLASGVSTEAAQTELRGLGDDMRLANTLWTPPPGYRSDTEVVSLHDATVGDVRSSLLMLTAAVLLLLLVACANVANLVLVRGFARARELVVRRALGASRGVILRHVMTETLVLAVAGGVAGIALAWLAVDGLIRLLPPDTPRLDEIGVNLRVLGASVGVTLATGLALGVLPALRLLRLQPGDVLREDARAGGARSDQRTSGALVVSQVALAVLLVTGAGLLVRSLTALQQIDTGISAERVLTARVSLPAADYPAAEQRLAFHQQLLERIQALPGVTNAAITSQLPFGDHLELTAALVEHVTEDPNNLPVFTRRRVTPDFFATLGIPLRRGRLFSEADAPGAVGVAIVDETTAHHFWPGQDPLGRRLGRPWIPGEMLVVVGVVADVRDNDLGTEPTPIFYTPLSQDPPAAVFVTAALAPQVRVTATTLRDIATALDRNVPVSDVALLSSLVARSLAPQRLTAVLIAALGALALLLAAVGIYSVVAFTVGMRVREFGVRAALGARAVDLLGLVLRRAVLLAVAGLAIGLAAALALTRTMRSILYDVQPQDAATFTTVAVLMLLVSVAAAAGPAWSASRVAPMKALRE